VSLQWCGGKNFKRKTMIKNIQILGLVGLATVNPIWIMLNQQSMSPIIVSLLLILNWLGISYLIKQAIK